MRLTVVIILFFVSITLKGDPPPKQLLTLSEAKEIVTGMLFDDQSDFKHRRHYYYQYKNRIRLRVEGELQGERFEALVDEKSSRVFYLKVNGQLVYEWKGIEVIAHRGAVRLAPENTIPAFQKAIELGADRIELDVRETSDGKIVVFHDSHVDRTTNGRGKVSEMTLQELKALDAGSWFSDQFKGARVPTLREALEVVDQKALIEIDYKQCDLRSLISILDEFNLLYTATIYVRDHATLRSLRALEPRLLLKTVPAKGRDRIENLMNTIEPEVVNVKWLVYKQGLAADIHRRGVATCLNSLRFDKKVLIDKMIDDLPDYLITNRLEYTLTKLREMGWHN